MHSTATAPAASFTRLIVTVVIFLLLAGGVMVGALNLIPDGPRHPGTSAAQLDAPRPVEPVARPGRYLTAGRAR